MPERRVWGLDLWLHLCLALAIDGGGHLHFPGALSPVTEAPVVTEEGAGCVASFSLQHRQYSKPAAPNLQHTTN